jgi:hypothetical protein
MDDDVALVESASEPASHARVILVIHLCVVSSCGYRHARALALASLRQICGMKYIGNFRDRQVEGVGQRKRRTARPCDSRAD